MDGPLMMKAEYNKFFLKNPKEFFLNLKSFQRLKLNYYIKIEKCEKIAFL